MDTLQLTRLTLTLTPDTPWSPGPELGNTLRGAFGAAVHDVACVRSGEACADCAEREVCLYPIWYEGQGSGARPFALRVAWPNGELVSQARPIRLGLVFFGRIPRPGLVIEALHRMARTGLGPRRVPHRVAHGLVEGDGAPVTLLSDGPAPIWPEPRSLSRSLRGQGRSGDARVTLVTRVDFGKRVQDRRPTPADLLLLAKARVIDVARSQGERVRLDLPRVEEAGGRWEHLHYERVWRRSASQNRRMPMHGWVGSVVYPAERIDPFRDLLAAAELLQVGGWTTAGLGVVAVEENTITGSTTP